MIDAALAAIARGTPATLSLATQEYGHVCGGSILVYVEPLGLAPRLVIVGAGHVGRALATVARFAGFRVIVSDERLEFAAREQVTDAHEILHGDAEGAHCAACRFRHVRGDCDPQPRARLCRRSRRSQDACPLHRPHRQQAQEGGPVRGIEAGGVFRRGPGAPLHPCRPSDRRGQSGGDCREHRRPAHSEKGRAVGTEGIGHPPCRRPVAADGRPKAASASPGSAGCRPMPGELPRFRNRRTSSCRQPGG